MTPPPPTANDVARALASAWMLLGSSLTGAWVREHGGAMALVTRVPIATLNGVWVIDETARAQDIEAGLDAVAATGIPHCVQLRPGADDAVLSVPKRRGLLAEAAVPLMAAPGPLRAPATAEPLSLRRLAPAEAGLHCEIAAEAFGAPTAMFAGLVTPEVLELAPMRAYVGEVGDEPVVTAVSATIGDGVAIFNVATSRSHRRRGFGAAATAQAVADGVQAGASWAWLQSSEIGYGVYQRLGFETLEWWDCWVTPP